MLKQAIIRIIIAIIMIAVLCDGGNAKAAAAEATAGAVTTGSSSLHVRASAGTGSAVLTSLKKGSYVTLLSRSGSWWHVEYAKGKTGYCHSDYITPVAGSAVTVRTRSGNLNVRQGPDTSHSRIGTLTRGETVIFLSEHGGWSRILFHGTRTGYVSSQYLSSYFAPVSLNVPNFKQTDSRWSAVLIGQSGKTMAQIGCATTAIAMMESYRSGTRVYPDAMAQRLRYTPDGSVYWPADYSVVTETAGYLNRIHTLLLQGKPVLLGARNSGGKQHWVVITGFGGGSALNASGFAIHDPGSSTRRNLQMFFDAYPMIYKYFHY